MIFVSFWLWAATVASMASSPVALPAATSLSQVKSIYIEPLGPGKQGDEFRDRIISRLKKDGRFELATNPSQADAIMQGTAQIWITGYVSQNPHSPALKQAVYSGFLSARVTNKENQVLWSYLVTPRKFAWGGIVHDLADGLASKLMDARDERSDVSSTTPSKGATVAVTLHGAGATFPEPLYQKWFESFAEQRPDEHIAYDGVGSEEGIRLLQGGKVDFAASDMPLTDQQTSSPGGGYEHFPSVLGAVVPIYNLAGVARPLNFTPEILAGIYLGKIKRWNDGAIRAVNRGFRLPDAEIVVIHRSDGSGTTFVWSDFLAKVSREWKADVGTGADLKWPVGTGAERNDGVALAVQRTPNAIGYVEMVYALQHELNFGTVRNSAGEFVRASLASVTAAAANAAVSMSSDFRVSITNSSGPGVYPIASFTWILVPRNGSDAGRKAALKEILEWILTQGQKTCSELGYAPLPREVVGRELDALAASR